LATSLWVACDPSDSRVDENVAAQAQTTTLSYGTSSQPISVAGGPSSWGWIQFSGSRGDQVVVQVSALDGEAVGYVVDASRKQLAYGRAAHGGGVARLELTLAADGVYSVAFRDFHHRRATLTVTLDGEGIFTCASDHDCVAVARAECCPTGLKAAINASAEARYYATYACGDHPNVCPIYLIVDRRVAECNRGSRRCELIDPEQIQCGGFIRDPHQCAPGWTCQRNAIPDLPGQCIAN
jgi:hypothetical protein